MREHESFLPGTIVRNPEAISADVDAFIIHGKNWREYPPGKMKKRISRVKRAFKDDDDKSLGFKELVDGILNDPRSRNKIRKILKDEDKTPFKLRLSMDSKITAIAAGMIWASYSERQEKPPVLIFSTGKTAGKDWPSEAEAMVEYMKSIFPYIPDNSIKLEDISYDTPGNIIESKKIIEREGYKNVGFLTIGYHGPRVATLMDYYDVPITAIHPTEQILAKRSKHHKALVNAYTSSDIWRQHKRGEAALSAEEAFLDPGQKLLSKHVTPRIRHQ